MKQSLLALALVAAIPALTFSATASAADNISYTYVEGGYAATDTESGDADGFAVKGSGAIAPNFHLFGGYSQQEIEDTSIDFDQWRVGVGYNHEISPRADLLTRVAYEQFDAGEDFLGNELEADGYSVEAGIRGSMTPMLEGYALAGYEDGESFDGGDIDGQFYGRVGGQLKFNPTWGLSGDVKFADGDTQFFVGPRITF